MLKVGITGGIGSGKSLVAKVFTILGIPVLNADDVAKLVMEQKPELVASIKEIFGKEAYINDRLNRSFIASKVFNNQELLARLNAVVHPVTIQYANDWALQQTAPYILKEAAIFFESGSYKEMDKMVGVYAPQALRLQRAMQRDGASEAEILKRMDKQMNEEEKMSRCDFVIDNSGAQSLIKQVIQLHEQLLAIV